MNTPKILQALSIWQPYAWLIVKGYKDIENRTWSTEVRGWVLVHASAHRVSRADFAAIAATGAKLGIELPHQLSCPRGAFVGAMRIDEVVLRSASAWFNGPYGFKIGQAVQFENPVPAAGNQLFFNVPAVADIALEIYRAGLQREFTLSAA